MRWGGEVSRPGRPGIHGGDGREPPGLHGGGTVLVLTASREGAVLVLAVLVLEHGGGVVTADNRYGRGETPGLPGFDY